MINSSKISPGIDLSAFAVAKEQPELPDLAKKIIAVGPSNPPLAESTKYTYKCSCYAV